ELLDEPPPPGRRSAVHAPVPRAWRRSERARVAPEAAAPRLRPGHAARVSRRDPGHMGRALPRPDLRERARARADPREWRTRVSGELQEGGRSCALPGPGRAAARCQA